MIAIGCDFVAYELKEKFIEYFKEKGIPYRDFGCDSTAFSQYPHQGYPVAKAVAEGNCDCGVLLCGTGLGMSMVANKIKGIRAACVSDCFSAKMAKLHNNANILTMGAYVPVSYTHLAAEAPSFGGGTGTQEDPWLITSQEDLIALAEFLNSGNAETFDTEAAGIGNCYGYYFR